MAAACLANASWSGASLAFPISMTDRQCIGLTRVSAGTATECELACCRRNDCDVYQYCPLAARQQRRRRANHCQRWMSGQCFIGKPSAPCGRPRDGLAGAGWVSRARLSCGAACSSLERSAQEEQGVQSIPVLRGNDGSFLGTWAFFAPPASSAFSGFPRPMSPCTGRFTAPLRWHPTRDHLTSQSRRE